jgi:hypothetical protein
MTLSQRIAHLFRRHPPAPAPALDDPDFGRLVFNAKGGSWSGCARHGDRRLDVTVVADVQGPSDRQRTLWRRLRPELPRLSVDVARRFHDQAVSWFPGVHPIFYFRLDAIELAPEAWQPRIDTVLCFTLEGDDDGFWRAELRGFDVVGASRDH